MSLRRECNRETREIHQRNPCTVVKQTRESTEDNEGNEDERRPFVLLVCFCSIPPGIPAPVRRTTAPPQLHSSHRPGAQHVQRIKCVAPANAALSKRDA